jgi:hypothetical protein
MGPIVVWEQLLQHKGLGKPAAGARRGLGLGVKGVAACMVLWWLLEQDLCSSQQRPYQQPLQHHAGRSVCGVARFFFYASIDVWWMCCVRDVVLRGAPEYTLRQPAWLHGSLLRTPGELGEGVARLSKVLGHAFTWGPGAVGGTLHPF